MRSITSDQIADALGDLYGAAYGQVSWPTAIATLCRLFHGSAANFVRHGPDLRDGDLIATETDPAFQTSFIQDFGSEENPFIHAAMLAEIGKVFTDRTLFNRDALRRSRYWNEWMEPQDMYGGLFCKIWSSPTSVWAFNVQRGQHQEEFSPADAELLERLLPHLARAAEIGHSRQKAETLVATFAQLPFGAMLIGPDQWVIETNDCAEKLLARPDSCLHIETGRLVCASSQANDLRRLIDAAALPLAQPPVGFLLVQSAVKETRPDPMISVRPIAKRQAFGIGWEPCVAIIMREASPQLPEGFDAYLRQAFNLTPAEARLAAHLCAGQTLKAAAALQEIQFSTARHYLENIFHKTGTRQQSQLVALMMNLQPLLWT